MTQFCKDIDLLKWEPILFTDLTWAWQTLAAGADGAVSGTTFESESGGFDTAGIGVGHVIYLWNSEGSIDGCYEIVSVDSATELTISVVRADAALGAIAPPSGLGLNYRISTFDPQAQEAAEGLLQYFDIKLNDDTTAIDSGDIADGSVLRQASVFAVLSALFTSGASATESGQDYWQKSLRYQQLFYTSRVKIRLGIDRDGDSFIEEFRSGGSIRLRRC